MTEKPDGDWVKYGDIAARESNLLEEVAELHEECAVHVAENARLRKALEAIAEIDSRSLLDPRHIATEALRGAAGGGNGS